MKMAVAAVVGFLALAGLVAGGAYAAGGIASHVVIDGAGQLNNPLAPGQDSYVFGHVESKKAACLAKRKVVVKGIYETEGKFRLYGAGTTGTHGGFDAIGAFTHNGNPLGAYKLSLKPRKVGGKTCRGETLLPA